MPTNILRVGIDDTDSSLGMCTTYLGFKMVGRLKKRGAKFSSYPRLVRFNPNIPWKTRGNGAVGIEFSTDDVKGDIECITRMIEKNADVKNGANPAAVFCTGDVPKSIRQLGNLAMWRLVRRADAKNIVCNANLKSFHLGNGQGLVGAACVMGYDFGHDSTLEMLSYRKPHMFGRHRSIDENKVKHMQQKTAPMTFSSYDETRRRVMIAPHGPDPVLYGIRGEDAHSILAASSMVKTREKSAGYMIFQSNQGTASHLGHKLDVSSLEPYMAGTVSGVVYDAPRMLRGGHIIFKVQTADGSIPCAVYKESGMTVALLHLVAKDKVTVGGGIRPASRSRPRVLNVEFVRIHHLKTIYEKINPTCLNCHKNMKSKGSRQGFKCIKCGDRATSKKTKQVIRTLQTGMYLPDISAQRHLTRPAQRQKRTNIPRFRESFRWFYEFQKNSGE
ncbi:MAG: DNA-binding protein [Cenarchaeum symbiont of Oopsacas minuta]|nr:DNA-binding protein [Cenarchaeum symbiont of Oopsacas minuta]